jgi:hypothetical protein
MDDKVTWVEPMISPKRQWDRHVVDSKRIKDCHRWVLRTDAIPAWVFSSITLLSDGETIRVNHHEPANLSFNFTERMGETIQFQLHMLDEEGQSFERYAFEGELMRQSFYEGVTNHIFPYANLDYRGPENLIDSFFDIRITNLKKETT